MPVEKEFKVNDNLTLKLENNETHIYIAGQDFKLCKFILLDISEDKIDSFEDIESIDDSALSRNTQLPPETVFWAHSSNLQVWSENRYDTQLLHGAIAFPLLKRLVEVGDPLAKEMFIKELKKKFKSGNRNVIHYLIQEDYLEVLKEQFIEEDPYNDYINYKAKIDQLINLIELMLILVKEDYYDYYGDFNVRDVIKSLRNKIDENYYYYRTFLDDLLQYCFSQMFKCKVSDDEYIVLEYEINYNVNESRNFNEEIVSWKPVMYKIDAEKGPEEIEMKDHNNKRFNSLIKAMFHLKYLVNQQRRINRNKYH